MVEGETYGVLLTKKTIGETKMQLKKSISMGNILAVVLLTALFAMIYCLGNVRI